MRPAWRKEFLHRLAKIKPAYWRVFETRLEYIDEEDIKLLSELKAELQFGIESGSPRILLLMKKTRQPQKFLERFSHVSRLLSRYRVLHRANLIFNHPGETAETLGETFAFMDSQLGQGTSYLLWGCAQYMHFPGCELDRNYEKEFGSRFIRPEWWREAADQYSASIASEPSADLSGERTKLWQTMLAERDEHVKSTLAPEAFDFAAQQYYYKWQFDPRFGRSRPAI